MLSVRLSSPSIERFGPSNADIRILPEERGKIAARLRGATIDAVNFERGRRTASLTRVTVPLFWAGTIIFAVVGFILVSFAKPVIDQLGKSVGEAIAKDVEPEKLYRILRDRFGKANAVNAPVFADGTPAELPVTPGLERPQVS